MKVTPTQFYKTARSILASGRAVSFTISGESMRPFLKAGTPVTLKSSPSYNPGDIVFARTYPTNDIVLHYITDIKGEFYTLMGAANLQQTEWCRTIDVAGRLVNPNISRHSILTWHRLLPIRRYLLWIYRNLIS